jgi:hypothetical protein
VGSEELDVTALSAVWAEREAAGVPTSSAIAAGMVNRCNDLKQQLEARVPTMGADLRTPGLRSATVRFCVEIR